MTVNTIHIGPFQGSQKFKVGRGYKKIYVGVREMRFGKSLKTFLENVENLKTF